jgi:GPH family glycoside/pentoside/hexuronide:cation symporter
VLAFVLVMPNRDRVIKTPRHSLWTSTKIVLEVPAFRLLLTSFFIVQAANALTAGLTVLFVTHVIGQPQLIGAFLGLLFLSTAVFLPVWIVISLKRNKKTAWICSIVFCALALASAFTLTSGSILGAALLCIALGACFGCDAIMPTSMLADIVYHYEERGENRFAGVFLAVKNAVSKLTFVIPMAIAFPVLDLVGFREAGANGPAQLQTLLIFFAAVPIVLRIGALILLSRSTALPFAAPALPESSDTA